MKIKKFEKNYSQLAWKKNVIQIRNLKQALNQRWAIEKSELSPYIQTSLVKTIPWYEHRANSKCDKSFQIEFFKVE